MPAKSGRPPRSSSELLEIRDKIATEARKLFRDEGFAAVSIRRLAEAAGCAPMTIYAHFDGKADILRFLWADVLRQVFDDIKQELDRTNLPHDRLVAASRVYLRHWLTNPDHFRLVFLSNGVARADVQTFMADPATLHHFDLMSGLVSLVAPAGADVKARTDMLVAGLTGIALCLNTVKDYPWSDPDVMTGALVAAATGPL